MRLQSAVLAASLVLALAACGNDEPATPTTPVTLKVRPLVYADIEPGAVYDTVRGILIVDGTDTLDLPFDSLTNFPRGVHSFRAKLNIEYFDNDFTATVNPRGNTFVVDIPPAETCRVYQSSSGQPIDATICTPQGQSPRNVLYWSERKRIFCNAGDFIEFCTPNPSRDGLGLTWPVDDANSAANEYVSQAKLLVAATVGTEVGGSDAGRKIAMALYRVGDYSPRRRLTVVAGDSSRYSNVAWTDVRHVPVFNFTRGQLEATDRRNALFGLEVKATYFLPKEFPDVIVVRYDVTNISTEPDFRRVHPEIGPGGFTLRDIYLTPVIDADIGNAFVGGRNTGEADDDVATIFPAEGLAAAWDRTLAVAEWLPPWKTGPGLVGLKVLGTDAGTPKGVVFVSDTLDYFTAAREAEAYAVLTAGRGATLTGCTSYAAAFICGTEVANDVRIGYSVGPVATLAPGQRRTLTVALMLAAPSTGEYTSGTGVAPGNTSEAELASTTKASYRLAGNLRALAASIATLTVDEAP
jgi:hypothetical protein